MSEIDVSLRARFERFPATVKGAFVVRGEDPDPHQLALHEARVVRVPGAGSHPLPVAPVTLDVPPHKDLFVPFEFAIGDLEPGWYGLEADVDIDGAPRTMPGGRLFCVPWPRGAVRSATLRVSEAVQLDDGPTVSVERCQSGPEGLTVRYSVQPPQEVSLRLYGDDTKLDVVEQEVEPASGKGTAKAYPLLRSHRRLRIEITPTGRAKAKAEIHLDVQ